jgi:hypothetical protein
VKDIFDKLAAKIGASVTRIEVHVLFHQEDAKGEICDVLMEFNDGAVFEMACGGDGRVVVRSRHVQFGLPPDIEERSVSIDVDGVLHSIQRSSDALRMTIGGQEYQVENAGDEIAIFVNGRDISSRLKSRNDLQANDCRH